MADQILDNSRLEALAAEFAKDRQKEKYAQVMEIVEKSVLLVPILKPQGLDEKTEKLMQEGKPVKLPGNAAINPCLLRKDDGGQVLPIFTSAAQIPRDKRSPAILAMPFHVCLSMVTANQDHVEAVVLNPFTHNILLPKAILDVAVKRRDVMKNIKTVRMTKEQFEQMVHNRMALHLLPQYLFKHREDGLKELQREEGSLLLRFYEESYSGNKEAVTGVPEDFSVMTLNVTEDMQITRVDMPERTNKKGMCYRVYAVWVRGTQELFYYTLEKTQQGNYIGRITSDGKHELVEAAPDNGAEIEAIMNLTSGT